MLREAFAFTSPPKCLLRDRDGIHGLEFRCRAQALGLEEVRIAPRSPCQSPYVERLIGMVRCECLDHVIVLNQARLYRLLETKRAISAGRWVNLDEDVVLAGIVRFLPFIIHQCQLTLLPGSK